VPVEIIHIEFKSANFARTTEFYAKLFDWQTEQNGAGSYMKLNGTGGPSGGWIREDLIQAPGPVAYLGVEDLEKTLDEVEAAGGRVLVRSQPFAGGGEIGLFADPDGNIVGLWRRKAGQPAQTTQAETSPGSDDAEPAAPKAAKALKPAAAKPAAAKKPPKKTPK
jgi:uncharacterized protein